MEGEGIRRRDMLGRHSMPGDLLGLWNQVQAGRGQYRGVQDLTDMARGLGTAGVLVQEGAAGG